MVIGVTTGGVIGQPTPFGSPSEVEARAGISILLANTDIDTQDSGKAIHRSLPLSSLLLFFFILRFYMIAAFQTPSSQSFNNSFAVGLLFIMISTEIRYS